jgi:hypothetical protein
MSQRIGRLQQWVIKLQQSKKSEICETIEFGETNNLPEGTGNSSTGNGKVT